MSIWAMCMSLSVLEKGVKSLRIRIKYPDVRDWYASLDQAVKERVDQYLARTYVT